MWRAVQTREASLFTTPSLVAPRRGGGTAAINHSLLTTDKIAVPEGTVYAETPEDGLHMQGDKAW